MSDADFNEQLLFLREKLAELGLAAVDRDANTGQTRVTLTPRGRALQPDLKALQEACRKWPGDKQDLLDTAIALLARGT